MAFTPPQLLTDFLGIGALASRPSSPNLAANTVGFWYDTTNSVLTFWNGSVWGSIVSNAPTIVQVGQKTGTVGTVTMGAAPTQNNLLVALVSTQGVNPAASAGWTIVPGTNSTNSKEDLCAFYKVAGAAESTSQTPTTDANTGCVTIFEIKNATTGIEGHNGTFNAVTAFTISFTGQSNKMVVGMCTCQTNTAVVSSLSNITSNGFAQSGARSNQAFHITAPSQSAQTVGVNWTAAQSGGIQVVEIG